MDKSETIKTKLVEVINSMDAKEYDINISVTKKTNILTNDDKKKFIELLAGWNEVDDNFFKDLELNLLTEKWNSSILEGFMSLIRIGFLPALLSVKQFVDHPDRKKIISDEVIKKTSKLNFTFDEIKDHVTVEKCSYCGKKDGKLFRCSNCKKVTFCSKECLTNSWKKNHKVICSLIKK